ncbi:MAG: peptidylprolyl isomerase [Snowella sp.]|nr:peptidylprolyl isomerase [Snowella sp.]
MPSLSIFILISLLQPLLRWLKNEPLAQFAIAAALLFLLYGGLSKSESNVIDISLDNIPAIAQQRQLLGRPLTDQEQAALIAQYVDEEVLLREAQKLDLIHRDGDIRQAIIDKMAILLSGEPPEPTPTQLKNYLNDNRYRLPPLLISFDQVFFQGGNPKQSQTILMALRQGKDFCTLGDAAPPTLKRMPEQQLIHDLGPAFVSHLSTLKEGEWVGPLVSIQGHHFVRVTEKLQAKKASFEQLENNLRETWFIDWRKTALEKKLIPLRSQHSIHQPTKVTGNG